MLVIVDTELSCMVDWRIADIENGYWLGGDLILIIIVLYKEA